MRGGGHPLDLRMYSYEVLLRDLWSYRGLEGQHSNSWQAEVGASPHFHQEILCIADFHWTLLLIMMDAPQPTLLNWILSLGIWSAPLDKPQQGEDHEGIQGGLMKNQHERPSEHSEPTRTWTKEAKGILRHRNEGREPLEKEMPIYRHHGQVLEPSKIIYMNTYELQ